MNEMTNHSKPHALLRLSENDVPLSPRHRLTQLVTPTWCPSSTTDALGAPKEESTILVGGNSDLTRANLVQLPALRLAVCFGTAYDQVDVAYCRQNGIKASNTPGYAGVSVAEHAMALMLSAIRKICPINEYLQSGKDDSSSFMATDLAGKTAGIIGLGDIGSRIARMAQAFEMKVIYFNRSAKHFHDAEQVDLQTLLSQADVLFLCVPLTSETQNILNAHSLSCMKSTSIIVNISADELIDPGALGEALTSGKLRAAAIDVIGDPGPYRGLPNLIMTHLNGWMTEECRVRWADTWIDAIEAFLHGNELNSIL